MSGAPHNLCYNAAVKITIIQVGKTKAGYLREGENEYLKRLKPHADVKIITLKETAATGSGPASREQVKDKEAEAILQHLPAGSYIVALDEKGRQYTSTEFAALIEENRDFKGADITFITGGCYGLGVQIFKKAHLRLSFGLFTYTHELIRTLLLEQIYRSFSIITGKTYHY